ncbi:tungsten formylmethanofuran dehydrogenase [bacterium]|nr:tungsten formylmethanofuran dehydrogenase [bacterium]
MRLEEQSTSKNKKSSSGKTSSSVLVASSKKPKTSSTLTKELLARAYRDALRARLADEKTIVLYKQNKCHFQIGCAGHEIVQIAAAYNFKPSYDYFYPYYRNMAFCVGVGMTTKELMLNAMNRADDPNSGGRQMPMHYGHNQLNIINQSSPTGTQFLQAVGTAMAAKYRGTDQVVYVSTGEGTTSQGDYHEALNWAAREKLPVVFLVEDNEYAISVHISEQTAGKSVAGISSGYDGLEVVEVDGLDFEASHQVFATAVERARSGGGPTVVVAKVVRLQSHSISDNQAKYRDEKDILGDQKRDPLLRMESYLTATAGFSTTELKKIREEVIQEVDAGANWAEAQPEPAPHTALDHVYVDLDPGAGIVEKPATGEETFIVDAINHALDEELARNPEMVIFGQDVAHGKGGVFTVTAGLTAKYGIKRVFNAPLAEASIAGAAVGMAAVGMRPVAEIQFGDYIWTAMMQIRNELAIMNYRSNGTWTCPAVLRVPIGGYIHGAVYHSQNIEATFAHFPGLYVVLPSNATDAKGLLKSAIRGKDPVLFLEHKGLYRQVYAKGKEGGADDLIPLGRAKVVRPGKHATIVTWGALVQKSLLAAEELAKAGAEVEVIDLRTIVPLDTQTILESVKKTSRLLVAHEDVLFMGFGAEIAAFVAEHAFEYLDAPVKRIGGKASPIPHSPVLEAQILPQTEWITEGLRQLLAY